MWWVLIEVGPARPEQSCCSRHDQPLQGVSPPVLHMETRPSVLRWTVPSPLPHHGSCTGFSLGYLFGPGVEGTLCVQAGMLLMDPVSLEPSIQLLFRVAGRGGTVPSILRNSTLMNSV